jgi:phenylpropionate dioxygenase-like ring-hydroxylating dioxygenase large terminal subunit
MNPPNFEQKQSNEPIRPDFVPLGGYFSRDILELEKQRLWPRVWLVAAREEQFKSRGDFVTLDMADESIVIVRNEAGELRAFYNVCQHRGRRLVQKTSGNLGSQFLCPFHAWRYDLNGRPTYIRDRQDWNGCEHFDDSSLSLKDIRLETWGGWVWICMDPEAEPLLDFLAPIPAVTANFEYDLTRISWYKTVVMPGNWKVVVDAFNETYHAAGTHPQVVQYGVARKNEAVVLGRHTSLRVTTNDTSTEGSQLKPKGEARDLRKHLHALGRDLNQQLHAVYGEHFVRAGERLLEELPEETPADEVLRTFKRFHREEMEKSGARWPEQLTDEEGVKGAGMWHIFPNTLMISSYDGVIWFRMRPNGDDPDSSLFDIWWLGRFAPGKEPPYRHEL